MPSKFREEIIAGLSAEQKNLSSKYFYDVNGDAIFQQIMACDDYYLTDCDMEIFADQSEDIARTLTNGDEFEIIELGAGDAIKSTHLLKKLSERSANFSYVPIDISENIIALLEDEMPDRVPGITVNGLAGEYLEMLKIAYAKNSNRKVLLFLGSSIGNFEVEDAVNFLTKLYAQMNSGDRLLIGFDLKKEPQRILSAYNDEGGLTVEFNLNLLKRINRELDADFVPENFEHFPIYNPMTGACRSFLVSKTEQSVNIGDRTFDFEQYEAINMELSQKFTKNEIATIASEIGFVNENMFCDTNNWYCNMLWTKR